MTGDELKAWAYSANETMPPDFDLVVARAGNAELLLELAGDPGCPERDFCLHCLYVLAGDIVRGDFRDMSRHRLLQLVGKAQSSQDPRLSRWSSRTGELVERPESFEYDLWCDGGHLEQDAAEDSSERGP